MLAKVTTAADISEHKITLTYIYFNISLTLRITVIHPDKPIIRVHIYKG